MGAVAWVTGILVTLGFLASGVMKLTKQPMAVEAAQRMGYTDKLMLIGGAEVLGAVGVFIGLVGGNSSSLEWLGFLGGLGLVATMIGALIFHRKVSDPPKEMAPAAVLGLLSLVYVIAILAR